MSAVTGIAAVARFQLRRLVTPQRLTLGLVGAAFPAALVLAVRRIEPEIDRNVLVALIYALIPEAVCMLGLLVSMCPAVADELERGTWPHVVVRPRGRRSLLVGTFIAAVAWTAGIAMVALALALAAAGLGGSPGLAAMFVASVGVAVVVEYLAGFLPAVVNQLTVSLRLRSMLVDWMAWRRVLPAEFRLIIDDRPPWMQIAALLLLAATLLVVATLILERRQFPPSAES